MNSGVRKILSITVLTAAIATGGNLVHAGFHEQVGGNGGTVFDLDAESGTFRNEIIFGRAARRVDSVGATNVRFAQGDNRLEYFRRAQAGGLGGTPFSFRVGNRCLTQIRVTTGRKRRRNTDSIFSIEFFFSDGSSAGPYGQPTNNTYLLPSRSDFNPNEEITGFFGRSADELDSIGVLTGPSSCN